MDAADALAEMQRLRDDELPMPLTGLVNIPISNLDNFWPETPATASGQTDGNKLDQSNGIRNERNERLDVR